MVMVTMMIMTKEILSSEILKWQLLQFLAVIFHFVTVISTSDIYRATRAVKRQKQTTQQTYNSLNFELSFCQRFWDLTKRRDDIVVADMEVDKVADKVADIVAEMFADIVAKKGTQFGKKKKKGYPIWWESWSRGLVNWPKLFQPEAYPPCVSSKLCEFI